MRVNLSKIFIFVSVDIWPLVWDNVFPGLNVKYLSTKEVARKVGIGRGTLERWLSSGELRPPRVTRIGRGAFRRWTKVDVDRVQSYKRKNYRKGRGRKKGDPAKAGKGK